MRIKSFKPWAEGSVGEYDVNGPKVETDATFDDDKISKGLTHERLPYPTFNRMHNRADTGIVSLIESIPPVIKDRKTPDRLLGIYRRYDCFADPTSDLNLLNIPGVTIKGICSTEIGGLSKLLVIDMTPGVSSVMVVDTLTMAVEDTVELSGGLASGTWTIQGITADGTTAYACFQKSTNEQYVQAYSMDTWTPAAGWPSTGTQYSTGSGLAPVRVINADSDSLAVASNNASIGTREMITLISKSTGVISDTGNGDSPATGTQVLKDITSNGEDLFFYIDGRLCSASIADLSVGCGGLNWPLTTTYGGRTFTDGVTVVSAGSSGITVAHVDDALGFTLTPTTSAVFRTPTQGLFDGLNFWLAGEYDPANAGNWRPCIAKFEGWHVAKGQAPLTAKTDLENRVKVFNVLGPSFGIVSGGGFGADTPIDHDGRDLFVAGTEDLIRLPLTHWR